MWNIFRKEISTLLSSVTGLGVILLFLVILSLFLWYMDGAYNILYGGYAELSSFFNLAPWLLLFVIPAVGMRSFSEEYQTGTIEVLLTKPVGEFKVISGKFLAVWGFSIIMIFPTIVYVYALKSLSLPGDHPDYSVIASGYIGLLLLSAVFSAASVAVSAATKSQMVAFIGAVSLLFLLYFGLYGLGNFNLFGGLDYWLRSFALMSIFDRFSRGLIYMRDIALLLLWTILFLKTAEFFVRHKKV